MWHRRGAQLFYKVIRPIFKVTQHRKSLFWPELNVYGRANSSLNSPMAMKWYTKLEVATHRRVALCFFKVICQIARSQGTQFLDFDQNWAFPDCNSSLNSSMALKWHTKLDVIYKRYPIVFLGHPSNFKVTRAAKSTIWIQFESDY